MSAFSEANVESIAAACRENIADLAESLQRNIGLDRPIDVGEQHAFDADAVPDAFDGPGLAVVIEMDGQALLGLIPATLPLPDWYTAPDENETSQLATIASEWAVSLLPEEAEPGRIEAFGVDNLRDRLIAAEPADGAMVLELTVEPPAETDSEETSPEEADADVSDAPEAESADEPAEAEAEEAAGPAPAAATTILLILPVDKPLERPEAADTSAAGNANSKGAKAALSPEMRKQIERLLPLPVTVSVRLAEKKIEMGNLLKLAPGTLVKFNKSCDDYLELYVNNFRYCRGEAIKIGEKFGLKIKDVGVVEEREERILNT